jgi:hypothetical protein
MATSMCSSKNTRKLSLHSILNIELFPTHTESKLGVLGVAGKLVKDIVQLWWRNFEKKLKFFSYMLPKQQTTKFWFQGILGVNKTIIERAQFVKACIYICIWITMTFFPYKDYKTCMSIHQILL